MAETVLTLQLWVLLEVCAVLTGVVMMTVEPTMKVNVEGLKRAVPLVASFGRRTILEQSVTSAAFICLGAQEDTAAVTIGATMRAAEVQGYTKTGRKSSAKNPFERRVSTVETGGEVPWAVLIVMARTNPGSKYSRMTGNRWPLDGGVADGASGEFAGVDGDDFAVDQRDDAGAV